MTETSTPPRTVIDLRNVCFRRNNRPILRHIDWLVEPGGHWAVIGANGSGKTTLLQIAGGILFPTSGHAEVLGCRFGATDLFLLRRRIGWVSSALHARMPRGEAVLDIVLSGLKATFGLVYTSSPDDAEKARETLRFIGLADREQAQFGVLSQGEQQKVLFARALMANPELLILDEPCSGLDLKAREAFLDAVAEVMARGQASVVMVTHHIDEIPQAIGHILLLSDGEVLASGGKESVLTSALLSQAFAIPVSVHRQGNRYWAGIHDFSSG